VRNILRILDSILLGQKAAKTASQNDDFAVCTKEMDSQTVDIVDQLLEGEWSSNRTLSVSSHVVREDAVLIGQWCECFEISNVVTYEYILEMNYIWIQDFSTESTSTMESDNEWCIFWPCYAIFQLRAIDCNARHRHRESSQIILQEINSLCYLNLEQ